LPINNLANTVPETANIMEFHFWVGVNPKSLTTSGIKGTIPNQAKKQMKKAMEVIQNVRIGTLLMFKSSNFVALAETNSFITELFIGLVVSFNNSKIRISTYYYLLFLRNTEYKKCFYEGGKILSLRL
tara:strand:- start:804 stop:1187 length:384 start_codon:yes stop_codon:yes gene_type:complete